MSSAPRNESGVSRGPRLQPRLVFARYDAGADRILIKLSNGLDLGVPVYLIGRLAGAQTEELRDVRIQAAGLGLNWPRLQAQLDLPALMATIVHSHHWMARVMGTAGGRVATPAKQAAARANGRLGGRPRKASLA
jgi:hypothetical protein